MTRKRTRATEGATTSVDVITQSLQQAVVEQTAVSRLKAYKLNPRDNKEAVPALMQSIKQFGFLVPVVIDANFVIAAGHTRVEAAKRLGMTHVLTLKADYLTEDQIKAFRLVDNKVSELSKWEYDRLAAEVSVLQSGNYDLTDFGWSQEQIDCLGEMVEDDCLSMTETETEKDSVRRQRPTNSNAQATRPATVRFVLGEFVIHVDADVYRDWATNIRTENDFEAEDIQDAILELLGVNDYVNTVNTD
jgi:hypothetical protein